MRVTGNLAGKNLGCQWRVKGLCMPFFVEFFTDELCKMVGIARNNSLDSLVMVSELLRWSVLTLERGRINRFGL